MTQFKENEVINMDDLKINKRLIMTPGPVSVDPPRFTSNVKLYLRSI